MGTAATIWKVIVSSYRCEELKEEESSATAGKNQKVNKLQEENCGSAGRAVPIGKSDKAEDHIYCSKKAKRAGGINAQRRGLAAYLATSGQQNSITYSTVRLLRTPCQRSCVIRYNRNVST